MTSIHSCVFDVRWVRPFNTIRQKTTVCVRIYRSLARTDAYNARCGPQTRQHTGQRTARHCVQGRCESRGHIGRVADDSHARDHRRSAPSEVGAVGPRVEDVVWLLCPAVRAGVRGTVRDRLMLPAGAVRVRCSIRLVRMYSREGCLHGTAVGSHQLPVLANSTILSGEAESRPDSGWCQPSMGALQF